MLDENELVEENKSAFLPCCGYDFCLPCCLCEYFVSAPGSDFYYCNYGGIKNE